MKVKLPNTKSIYLLIGLFVLLITLVISYLFFNANKISKEYPPLIDATMEIKLELSFAHLWLEELIMGDELESIEEINHHFDKAEWYFNVMVEGGINEEGTFFSIKDDALMKDIKASLLSFHDFRELANRRFQFADSSAIGSEVDQEFDMAYDSIINAVDEIESELQKQHNQKIRRFNMLKPLLVGFAFSLFIVLFIIIRTYIRAIVRFTQELFEQKENLAITLNSIGDGVIVTDALGKITRINPIAEKLCGYKNEDVEGLPLEKVFHIKNSISGKEVQNPAQKVLKEGKIIGLANHTKLISEDGTEYQIADSAAPVLDSDDKIIGVILVFRDVTEEYKKEEEKNSLISVLEDKNAELERFTYTVSHDLRSPLITIKGFLGMVLQDLKNKKLDRIEDDLGRISRAADKMQDLLEDLLELSRIGRLVNPPEEINTKVLVEDIVELLHGSISEGSIQVKVADDLPFIFGDKQRIGEVFQNLIENAIKFMGENSNPVVEIGCEHKIEYNHFYVKDNGIGIENKYHKKVFDLFDKLNNDLEGSGVGLSLVKRIIEIHHGSIWIESEGNNKGATFYFKLPIYKNNHE